MITILLFFGLCFFGFGDCETESESTSPVEYGDGTLIEYLEPKVDVIYYKESNPIPITDDMLVCYTVLANGTMTDCVPKIDAVVEIIYEEIDIISTTSFYVSEDRLFLFEDSYQFDQDTWICVGDCMHPFVQIPFIQQCNVMDGRAYFNTNGDGIICDLQLQNFSTVSKN